MVFPPNHALVMQIFVKIFNGHIITLHVEQSDTVKELKTKIKDRIGVPPDQQRLTFLGNQLQDGRPLYRYNIDNDYTIHLVIESFNLLIYTLAGKIFRVEVQSSDTVESVRTKVQEKEGFPPEQQILIYSSMSSSMVLQDGFILSDYNILRESHIHLVLHLTRMEINVKTPTGKTIVLGTALEVQPDITLGTLKDRIQDREGLSPADYQLKYDDKLLEDDSQTLSYYDIKKDSTLHIVSSITWILIKNLTGEMIALEVVPSDTISNVKIKLQEKIGITIPSDEQLLLRYDGELLEDSCKLSEYGIPNNSYLYLVSKLSLMASSQKLVSDTKDLSLQHDSE